jgi:hypothetical protein
MSDHLSFYATDYAKTRAFYEAAFAALGYANQGDMVTDWDTEWPTRRMCSYGPGNKRCFWVIESTRRRGKHQKRLRAIHFA